MVGDNESINASTAEQCEPLQDILHNVGLQDILMVRGIYKYCQSIFRAKWIFI